jgi:hypothetical protein
VHDGHESEVREACRDGFCIRNQDIGLNNMRGVCGILADAYTLKVTVHNIGVVKVFQPFNGVRKLNGAQ